MHEKIPARTWWRDILPKRIFKNSFTQAAISVSCAVGCNNQSHQASFNKRKTPCVAGVLKATEFIDLACFIRFIYCGIFFNVLLKVTACNQIVFVCDR